MTSISIYTCFNRLNPSPSGAFQISFSTLNNIRIVRDEKCHRPKTQSWIKFKIDGVDLFLQIHCVYLSTPELELQNVFLFQWMLRYSNGFSLNKKLSTGCLHEFYTKSEKYVIHTEYLDHFIWHTQFNIINLPRTISIIMLCCPSCLFPSSKHSYTPASASLTLLMVTSVLPFQSSITELLLWIHLNALRSVNVVVTLNVTFSPILVVLENFEGLIFATK